MSATPPIVRYIVVVHGMGEMRKNETLIGVVSRFAEARRGRRNCESYDVITLGAASGQSGFSPSRNDGCDGDNPRACPYLEFRGIPTDPRPALGSRLAADLERPFLGESAGTGEHLRFAECYWADITAEVYGAVGQPPEKWAAGLLGRLERKDAGARAAVEAARRQSDPQKEKAHEARRVPSWALWILRLLEETLVLLHRILAFRARALDESVFVKYLGDVQVYGEFLPVRGRSVRRFHRLLWRIEQWHEREEDHAEAVALETGGSYTRRQARYTVVAHSLGTVMALDALLLAHASPAAKASTERSPGDSAGTGLPFPGYIDEPVSDYQVHKLEVLAESRFETTKSGNVKGLQRDILIDEQIGYLDTDWAARVDSFVTLGSPIDKFLVLWWFNYRFLSTPDAWLDPHLASYRRRHKIRLFNYCDEQDPVGHRLDVAQSSATFKALFDSHQTGEDLVYNRAVFPGLAHVSYWRDLPLFARILRLAVDGETIPVLKPPSGILDALKGRLTRSGPSPPESFPLFDDAVYRSLLAVTYKVVPYALIVAAVLLFSWALYAEGVAGRSSATVALLLLVLVGRRLLDLLVWWRGLLRHKGRTSDLGVHLEWLGAVRWIFVALVPVTVLAAVVLPSTESMVLVVAVLLAAALWDSFLVQQIAVGRSTGWKPTVSARLSVWDVASRKLQEQVFRQDLGITQVLTLLAFSVALGGYVMAWWEIGARSHLLWILGIAFIATTAWSYLRRLVLRRPRVRSSGNPSSEAVGERGVVVVLGVLGSLTLAGLAGVGLMHLLFIRYGLGNDLYSWFEARWFYDWVRLPWLRDHADLLCLLTAVTTGFATATFGYVRYRLWEVHYRLSCDPLAGSPLIHLLLILPEPLVRRLAGSKAKLAGSPAVDKVEFDRYAASP